MDKRCCSCKEVLPISEFRIDATRKDGLSPRCVKCANKAEAVSYLKLKLKVVAHLGGACLRCGYGEDHRALAIDHVNGGGITERRSGMAGRRLMRAVLADTQGRYQLLCYNCNTIKRVEDDERGDRVYRRRRPSEGLPDKRCSRCETTKPAPEFHVNAARYDGLSVYCGPCLRSFTQNHHRVMRARAIDHCGRECLHCGYLADNRALVFDHVEGGGMTERRSGIVGVGTFRAVLADMTGRYQLLCANCNQIKLYENGERVGKRVYVRTIPTTRIDRPDLRGSAEKRAASAARARLLWQDPEYRARESARRSAAMKARWASGEIPNRKKPA